MVCHLEGVRGGRWHHRERTQFSKRSRESSVLLEPIRRGDLNAWSFGFTVAEGGSRWVQEGGEDVRELTDVTLYDCSVVVQPAYRGTAGIDLRSDRPRAHGEYRAARTESSFTQREGLLAQRDTQLRLKSHHVALLTLACEAHDRATSARKIIDREGLTLADKFGQRRQHPAVVIERDSRAAFARLIKQLDLDLTRPGPIGRPGSAA